MSVPTALTGRGNKDTFPPLALIWVGFWGGPQPRRKRQGGGEKGAHRALLGLSLTVYGQAKKYGKG
jgi:hypothetical protein